MLNEKPDKQKELKQKQDKIYEFDKRFKVQSEQLCKKEQKIK